MIKLAVNDISWKIALGESLEERGRKVQLRICTVSHSCNVVTQISTFQVLSSISAGFQNYLSRFGGVFPKEAGGCRPSWPRLPGAGRRTKPARASRRNRPRRGATSILYTRPPPSPPPTPPPPSHPPSTPPTKTPHHFSSSSNPPSSLLYPSSILYLNLWLQDITKFSRKKFIKWFFSPYFMHLMF